MVRTADEAECPCSSSGQLPFEATARLAADQMPKSCITFRSEPASFCPAIIGQSIDANVVNDEERRAPPPPPATTASATSMLHQLPSTKTHTHTNWPVIATARQG